MALVYSVSAMGIFDLFRGSNGSNGSNGWMTSKDVEVGKDYKYMGVCGSTTQGGYELPDVEAEGEEQVHESEEARF